VLNVKQNSGMSRKSEIFYLCLDLSNNCFLTLKSFADLHDGIERYFDDILFWEQLLIRFHKISKILGLSHQDHDGRVNISIFPIGIQIALSLFIFAGPCLTLP
jgi:hypothetical protein